MLIIPNKQWVDKYVDYTLWSNMKKIPCIVFFTHIGSEAHVQFCFALNILSSVLKRRLLLINITIIIAIICILILSFKTIFIYFIDEWKSPAGESVPHFVHAQWIFFQFVDQITRRMITNVLQNASKSTKKSCIPFLRVKNRYSNLLMQQPW